MKKLLLFAIAIILVLWIGSRYGDVFSLGNVQHLLSPITGWYESHRLAFIAIFVLLYVIVTASSLPFATVLTLLGGAVLGFWLGLFAVSFASTLGATLSFLISRYLLRDGVQNRFGNRLQKINEGFEKQGALYLFTLRMVPLFPFFLVNMLMGLTPIQLRQYVWVSWLGMLPGTAVYVYAGRNLGQLTSLSGILSPAMILSFTLVGVFPWIANGIIRNINARKIYKPFDKPKSFDRNLVVIGAGAAGLVSTYMATTVNAKVTLVEKNLMGGDCLNFGCVPSKALIKSSRVARMLRDASNYGLKNAQPEFDLKDLSNRIQSVIAAIEPNDSVERYQKLGADVVMGEARIIDPWRVEILPHSGRAYTLTTTNIIIASGAEPFVPPIPGLDKIDYLTSDSLWQALSNWSHLPKSLLVLGGGNIGCELAQAFAGLGVKVTIVEMADRLLAREDEEVSLALQSQFEHDGIEVLTAHQAIGFDAHTCTVQSKNGESTLEFDEVLVAVGRKARLEGFGLENLGIKTGRTVEANEYLQTNFPNIYVAGDAVAPYQFTHMAGYEGTYAALNAMFGQFWKFKMDYSLVPAIAFTSPEIARIGVNELEAQAQKIDYEVTYYPLSKLDRAETESETQGFIKILTPKGQDKILGVTIIGAHAGEILAEFSLAMKYKIGLRKIMGTIHAYPSWAEAAKNASSQWSQNHLNEKWIKLPEWVLKRRRG